MTRPQPFHVGEARAGDCLYIHATDADTGNNGGRAIGSDGAVISALFLGGAERAACDASHSHEVADAWVLGWATDNVVLPAQGELTQREQARCEAAFAAFVGRASEGSSLALTVAVPPPGSWADGSRVAVCLVGNRDGTFLAGHAAGSAR